MSLSAYFHQLFGTSPLALQFSPGRVNLIGEHTDYNGGCVLPTALKLGIEIALSARDDDIIRIASDGFEDLINRSFLEKAIGHWSDYVVGALVQAKSVGWLNNGVNIAIQSNISMGSGLSSSSALIVAILKLLRKLSGGPINDTALALLARKVETDFIGMPCGIMDQMAVAIAQPGEALFLDTKTLDYSIIPLPQDPLITILHSGIHRQLSDGRYKVRKEECDQVKALLGREDICLSALDALDFIDDKTLKSRARHCITEHRCTVDAVAMLEKNNYKALGQLMNQSHISMRDDFEITTREIDALVETCNNEGALGARMTGGGFGGCIVALVPANEAASWVNAVISRHPKSFYVA